MSRPRPHAALLYIYYIGPAIPDTAVAPGTPGGHNSRITYDDREAPAIAAPTQIIGPLCPTRAVCFARGPNQGCF